MKLCTLGLVALAPMALGQTVLLYLEDFPALGDGDPVSHVGWANDIPAANPNRLTGFRRGVGLRDRLGLGTRARRGGDQYHRVLHLHRPGHRGDRTRLHQHQSRRLQQRGVRVRIRDRWDADNMATRFAVQMDGRNWYVSTNVLPFLFLTAAPARCGPTTARRSPPSRRLAQLDRQRQRDRHRRRHRGAGDRRPDRRDHRGRLRGPALDRRRDHQFDDFQVRAVPFGVLPPSSTRTR